MVQNPDSPIFDTTALDFEWWDNAYAKWLLTQGWQCTRVVDIVKRLAEILLETEIPLFRLRITVRILHPMVTAVDYTWEKGSRMVTKVEVPHSVTQSEAYLNSPFFSIFEGAGGIRRRLDLPDTVLDYPILEELRDRGATDYVAMPFKFSNGQINIITLTSDRPGGFGSTELTQIYGMLPALGRVLEPHAYRHIGRTLLDTYLGKHAGGRVLEGLIKRGDGEDIYAVLWFCDLRDSTALADSMARRDLLNMLNDFFDCIAGSVLSNGGEVMQFIGDAVLAIFPIKDTRAASMAPEDCPEHRRACRMAIQAAREAAARIEALNAEYAKSGGPRLGYGIGLHLGEVTYGNIGVPERLQFTVVGTATNEVTRIEEECKVLGTSILASAAFVRVLPDEWISLGFRSLRGVQNLHEIFALRDEEDNQLSGQASDARQSSHR